MRCFLIVGPERSGNRLVASILVAAGCHGAGATFQPFGQSLPTKEDPAVVIRSLPHGNRWPNLSAIRWELLDRGYEMILVIACRDMGCTLQSQVASGTDPSTALANIKRAYRTLFHFAGRRDVASVVVPYESLVLHPVGAPAALLARLGLPQIKLGPVTVEGVVGRIANRNAQYYEFGGLTLGEGMP